MTHNGQHFIPATLAQVNINIGALEEALFQTQDPKPWLLTAVNDHLRAAINLVKNDDRRKHVSQG